MATKRFALLATATATRALCAVHSEPCDHFVNQNLALTALQLPDNKTQTTSQKTTVSYLRNAYRNKLVY